MAGLLDILNSEQGQLGLALLQAAGPSAQPASFGQRLGGAVGQLREQQIAERERQARERQRAQQEAMLALQIDELQRQQARQKQLDALPGQFMRSPAQQALAGGGGPTLGNAKAMETAEPGFDYAGYAKALAGVDPLMALQLQQSLKKTAPAPVQVAAGAALVDPTTGRAVFTNPKADDLPSAVREYQFARSQGYPGSFQQFQLEQKRAGASNVSVNTGQKGFDNTLKLRGDFRGEPVYKAQQEMQSAYSQIQQSLKQGTPAGDLAGATKIMKLLDPGSVVRESELGMAMAATGLLDRAQNYASNVISGNKLTPRQRQDFQRLADALMAESSKAYNAKRGEYQGIAQRNELNVLDVVGAEAAVPTSPAGDGWSIRPIGGN